jgi:CubicO group peptidase (beta-lactamase class C family)
LKRSDAYVHGLIEKGIIPGISLLVGKGDQILLNKHFGCRSRYPVKEELEEKTIYDLASLTKPLVTAFLILYLLEKEKSITLETPVNTFYPGFHPGMKLIHLLTHTSGLPGWYPFYLYGRDYFAQLKTLELASRPGRRLKYSCAGYILLYYIIEKMSGSSYVDFAREIIFHPLGLKNTFFSVPGEFKSCVAPTELGNREEQRWVEKSHREASRRFNWREGIIRGEVHDCNSWYLGGTAGNAGLFSTAEDIHRIALEFFPSTASILDSKSLSYIWHNFTPLKVSHRTAGFKRNSSFLTSGGRSLSRGAVGHNGLTGTSIWLEPRGEYTFILLTNYIHPEFKPVNIDRIRRKLHRLLVDELELSKGQQNTLNSRKERSFF